MPATGGQPLTLDSKLAEERLFGLAVFGERVAARTYALMGELRPRLGHELRRFAFMEGQHAVSFRQVARDSGIELDQEFAEQELGYLREQVEGHYSAGDFDALAVVQGFIVESLAIATYEPFLEVADRYPGATEVFARALAEEREHVAWVLAYLRGRFQDELDQFVALTRRVNVDGIECVGGTMVNLARYLDAIGLSGAQCAAALMDGYAQLLEDVGVDQATATRDVTRLFFPLLRQFRERASRQ